jgi:hypothetical protein
MNRNFWFAFAIALFSPIGGMVDPAIAQPQAPIMRLSSPQLQRVYRDLVRPETQDFFRQGREQFEQEIRQMNKPRSTEPVLKVNDSLQPYQDKPFSEPTLQPRRSF